RPAPLPRRSGPRRTTSGARCSGRFPELADQDGQRAQAPLARQPPQLGADDRGGLTGELLDLARGDPPEALDDLERAGAVAALRLGADRERRLAPALVRRPAVDCAALAPLADEDGGREAQPL